MSGSALDSAVARAFLVERYQDYLSLEQGSSPRTLEAYLRDVERFATYATVRGAATPTDVDTRALREFVYHL